MTALPTTTGGKDTMSRSLTVSAGLHLLGLLFLFFGLPVFMKPLPVPSVPVPLEIVDISDMTNTRIKEQKEETPTPPPPKPEPKAVTPPPPQPQPQPPQPPKPPQPEVTKPDQVEALTPAPKPAEKPKPPEEVKPKQDMLASVLKNVEKLKTAPQVKETDAKSQTKEQSQVQPKSLAPSLSDRLTISENDALVRQIEQHWNVPIGARDIQNIVVQIHIDVNLDRSVQHAEIISSGSMSNSPYFRAVAESALRAVYASSPLELPEGKYEQWKGIDVSFSARDML